MLPVAGDSAAEHTILVAVTERGHRVGGTHHRAKLSDEQVERIRDLYEYEGKSCRQIAVMFGMKLRSVRKICYFQRRYVEAKRWKQITVTP